MSDFEKYDYNELIKIAEKQQDQFYKFLNLLDEIVLIVDKDLQVEFLNSNAKDFFQITINDNIPLKHLFNSFEFEQKKEIITKTLQTKKTFQIDNLTEINGKEHYINNIFIPIQNFENDSFKIILIIRDITFKKYVENLNIKTNERFYKIFQNNPSVIIISRATDGKILEINNAVEKVFGYKQSEIIGKSTFTLCNDPKERAFFVDRILNSGCIFDYELEFKRKDGSTGWASVNADSIEIDEENCIIAIITDITEKKYSSILNETLYRISNIIYIRDTLENIYSRIHQEIKKIIYAENFFIALFSKENNTINFPYYQDSRDKYFPSKSFGNGLTEYVIKNKEAKLLSREDILQLSRKKEVEIVGTLCESWLGIPLLGENLTGVLAVQSYDPNIKYTVKDKNFLIFVGEQISRIIDRKFYEQKNKNLLNTYYSILNSFTETFFVTDSKLNMLFYNDRLLNILAQHKNIGSIITINDILPDFKSLPIYQIINENSFASKDIEYNLFNYNKLQIIKINDGFLFILK